MTRVRVLQVHPNFGLGGGERVVLQLLQGLDRQAFEPAVVSLYDEVSSELAPELDRLEVPLHFLGKRHGLDPRMFGRFAEVVRDFEPHVVHSHRYVLRYCLPALLRRRVPVRVHTVHNLAQKEVDRIGRLVHRVAFAAGVVPVAIAGAVADSLRCVYGDREIPLIPNGVAVAPVRQAAKGSRWRHENGFREDATLLLSVGRLEPQKNHELLLRAFAAALRDRQELYLLLAGDGHLEGDLRRLAAELDLEDRVRFLGFRRDVPELLGAADVLVVSSDYEGNPLSVMEAMAVGVPIVSTSVGGIPELVEEGREALLVPPGDAARLSGAIVRMAEDRDLRRELGERAARRAAEAFDVAAMVRGYEELYRRLLDDGAR